MCARERGEREGGAGVLGGVAMPSFGENWNSSVANPISRLVWVHNLTNTQKYLLQGLHTYCCVLMNYKWCCGDYGRQELWWQILRRNTYVCVYWSNTLVCIMYLLSSLHCIWHIILMLYLTYCHPHAVSDLTCHPHAISDILSSCSIVILMLYLTCCHLHVLYLISSWCYIWVVDQPSVEPVVHVYIERHLLHQYRTVVCFESGLLSKPYVLVHCVRLCCGPVHVCRSIWWRDGLLWHSSNSRHALTNSFSGWVVRTGCQGGPDAVTVGDDVLWSSGPLYSLDAWL